MEEGGQPERREDEADGGESWLRELSPVTLIVSVVTFLAIAAYALLLIVELFT